MAGILREEFIMGDKILVTQALDERDLLVKKIADKIEKASFVDTIKPNETKVFAKKMDQEEYAKVAESAYQQINDLICRICNSSLFHCLRVVPEPVKN